MVRSGLQTSCNVLKTKLEAVDVHVKSIPGVGWHRMMLKIDQKAKRRIGNQDWLLWLYRVKSYGILPNVQVLKILLVQLIPIKVSGNPRPKTRLYPYHPKPVRQAL